MPGVVISRLTFVAEFIGKTNLIEAVGDGPGVVARDGLRLRVEGAPVARGARVALSIRPHAIAVLDRGGSAPPAANLLDGAIERATYLGDAVDYHVRVDGTDLVLCASAAPGRRRPPGDRVRLAVPMEACAPVEGDE